MIEAEAKMRHLKFVLRPKGKALAVGSTQGGDDKHAWTCHALIVNKKQMQRKTSLLAYQHFRIVTKMRFIARYGIYLASMSTPLISPFFAGI